MLPLLSSLSVVGMTLPLNTVRTIYVAVLAERLALAEYEPFVGQSMPDC